MSANFFELATVLIPSLLFGSFLAGRLNPPEGRPRSWEIPIVGVLVLLGSFAIYAEVVAIEVALGGESTRRARFIVILAVVGATVLIVGSILWPWIAKVWRYEGRGTGLFVAIGAVAVLAVLAVPSVGRLERSIDFAESNRRTEEANVLIRRSNSRQREADRIANQFGALLQQRPPRNKRLAGLYYTRLEGLKDQSERLSDEARRLAREADDLLASEP